MWHLEFLEDPLAEILEYQMYLLSCKFLLYLLPVCVCKVSSSKDGIKAMERFKTLWVFLQSKDQINTVERKKGAACRGMTVS